MAQDLGELRARLLLEANEFKKGMKEAREEIKKTGASAKTVNTNFNGLNNALKDVGLSSSQIDKINDRIKKANPRILEKDLSEVRKELEGLGLDSKEIDKITSEIEKARKSTHNFKEDLDKVQKASAVMGGAIAAGIGIAVKTAADFEQQMSRVKAISGATSEEYKRLQKSAMDLGASTSKSASEVAKGMEDMAAMGFNVNEIIGAMPGVISAAEASGSDLAKTAGIVAAALNSFQLEATDASKVADILAMTANVSAANIEDMGFALKYVGPVANSLGISLEEVSAAIGIMTNAGLEGSQAGTSLRAALLALNNPAKAQEKIMNNLGFSMKDADGNAKQLSAIINDLTEATKHMTQADKVATIAKLVGTEAASGMIAVIDGGVDQLDEFTDALRNSEGASKSAADVMMDNLKGSYEEFSGALETLGIQIGNELLPLFTDIVVKGANVVNVINEMDTNTVMAGLAFAGTTAAIALTISTISKLVLAVRGLMLSMGPAGWLITGVSVLGGLLAAGASKTEDLQTSFENLKKEFDDTTALDKNIDQFDKLQSKSKLTTDEFARFIDINSEISKTTDTEAIKRLKDEQEKLREKSGLSNKELNRMVELNGDLTERVPSATSKITDQGNAIAGTTDKLKEYSKEKLASLYNDLDLKRLETEVKYKDILQEEQDIIAKKEKMQNKLNDLDVEKSEKQDTLNEKQQKLNEMLANRNKYSDYEIQNQQNIVNQAKQDVRLAEERVAKQAAKIIGQKKELENVQKEIKGYESIRDQMVQILLKQSGINVKKGEEIKSIDSAISKEEKKLKRLKANYEAGKLTTSEYREQAGKIQNTISKLQETKLQIDNLTDAATVLNRALSKDVTKTVTVRIDGQDYNIKNTGHSIAIPGVTHGEKKHTGGIVGRGQMPKLHVGGLASQFANAPLHNEIDVRLLRNEMVLTEAQQANLMRMIDAGITGQNVVSESDPNLAMYLQQQIHLLSELLAKDTNVYLDGKELYHSNKKYSDSQTNIRNIFKGVTKF
ncbi:hypothetical protein B4102_3583 [Heyndrickxia sporothermodurans]|uniref:Phage tail tape measure protein domain-containing protein n=1 Tax=Heyndrickxia sporothermodurans TaxID=46224 RepID=A0A150KMX2_9BACI|nr:phage tail tape measure protein [Heyndrickxia sporothermodurans]KYC94362.1 hypothetical protein B4102_3583 [Heyndrickxia sporothermodurans]